MTMTEALPLSPSVVAEWIPLAKAAGLFLARSCWKTWPQWVQVCCWPLAVSRGQPRSPLVLLAWPPSPSLPAKSRTTRSAAGMGAMDGLVVVVGLVPSLLIGQSQLPAEVSPHVGTMDLDVGLAFVVVAQHHYQAITEQVTADRFPTRRERGRQADSATLANQQSGGHGGFSY